MSLSIQTNVNSMIAQENLRVNSDFQSRTIQRLASGYRINSSGDDAAGLSIANQFRSDVSELQLRATITNTLADVRNRDSMRQAHQGGRTAIGLAQLVAVGPEGVGDLVYIFMFSGHREGLI